MWITAFAVGFVTFCVSSSVAVWTAGKAFSAKDQVNLGPSDQEIWVSALTLADQGNFAAAHVLANTASDQTLAPILQWIEYSSGQSLGTLADIAAFIDTYPQFPGIELVEIARESLLRQTQSNAAMLEYYANHPPINFSAQLHKLTLEQAEGQTEVAANTARKYWRTRTLRPADQAQLLDAFGDTFTQGDHQARLSHLMTHGAKNSGRRLIPHLTGESKALATAWTSNAEGKDIPMLLRDHPVFAVPRVLAADRNGDVDEAVKALERIPMSQRMPKYEWRARHIVVRELLKQQQFDRAFQIALNHGLFAHDGEEDDDVAEANWLAGWIALSRMGLTISAQQSFELSRNAAQSANWKAQAAYWLALTFESQMLDDKAKKHFEECAAHAHTYYGQLCTAKLGVDLFSPLAETQDHDSASNSSPSQPDDAQLDMLVDITVKLAVYKRQNDAGKFLYKLGGLALEVDDIKVLNQIALAGGMKRTSLGLSWVAAERQIFDLDGMLPLIEADLLAPFTLEMALLHAIASRESVFVIDAISPKGALGLMQVMPATGEQMAEKLALAWDQDRMTRDAGYNFTLGAAYLSQLVERFDGNLLLAIAGYNAGPSNVDKWINEFGNPSAQGIDANIWVESIPFRETRNYVKDVLARYNLYRARMTQQPVQVYTSEYLSRT